MLFEITGYDILFIFYIKYDENSNFTFTIIFWSNIIIVQVTIQFTL